MSPLRHTAALALAAATFLFPVAASAACSTESTGARCVVAPDRAASAGDGAMSSASLATAAVEVGDVLERGDHSILLNADYYGLPAVSDGWVYMRIERDVFRVDWHSQQVLERVTEQAAANF